MDNTWEVLTSLKTAKIGPGLWILLEDMEFNTSRGLFVVPAGFITDMASVPRALTWLVPPTKSEIAEASVLHDWFYSKNSIQVTRAFADRCLKEIMISRGATRKLGNIAYSGVRIGGTKHYRKDYDTKKLNKAYPEYQMCTKGILEQIFIHKD